LSFSSPEIIEGIEVRGTAEFRRRTRAALERLKSLPQFGTIARHIAVIRQGRRSGMKAWACAPTFVVGGATWRHSVGWYAGAIAHDAYHAQLYREAKQNTGAEEPCVDAWTGVEAEKLCLAFQREVLAELGADEKTLLYIDRCAQNPTYQGRNKGWKSRVDYLKRWW
jgi:hypothetical protein